MSPILAGVFFITEPLGKPSLFGHSSFVKSSEAFLGYILCGRLDCGLFESKDCTFYSSIQCSHVLAALLPFQG